MTDRELLSRIRVDSEIMAGKPVILGTRLTVDYILSLLAQGATTAEILGEYDTLTLDDIHACLLFAARSVSDTACMPLTTEPS